MLSVEQETPSTVVKGSEELNNAWHQAEQVPRYQLTAWFAGFGVRRTQLTQSLRGTMPLTNRRGGATSPPWSPMDQLIHSSRRVGVPSMGMVCMHTSDPIFSHLLGTDGVVGFASSLMTHTLKQRYTASLEWGKIFPSRETCPAQAMKAVYLFVRRCSRCKAALCWCARDDQPGKIRYLTTSPYK